jgi:hypothetical protein
VRSAAQTLIGATWLCENPLFVDHDDFNPIDWEQVAELEFTKTEQILVFVLSYLSGFGSGPDLLSIDLLNDHDRTCVLEALKLKWSGVVLEENL